MYTFSRFSENTVAAPGLEQYEKSNELVCPVGQSTQEEDADAPYLPVPQLTHVNAVVDPVFGLYFPTSQSTQLAVTASAYLPAEHGPHDDAAADE